MKTRRIYYGPPGKETSLWWTVRVTDARKNVVVNGALVHAIKGRAGVTIGCALSNTTFDRKNAKAFPHPVYLSVFTKSTALIVDKLGPNGSPSHAVRYGHSYRWVTDANDTGTLKKLAKEDPDLMQRPFLLRPPRVSRKGPHYADPKPGPRGSRASVVPAEARGALARAIKAGRMSKAAAAQLIQSMRA